MPCVLPVFIQGLTWRLIFIPFIFFYSESTQVVDSFEHLFLFFYFIFDFVCFCGAACTRLIEFYLIFYILLNIHIILFTLFII